MSETDYGLTRDGLVQLRRYWPAEPMTAAVLLIHGIAEHSGRYEHVGRFFSARGLATVAIDLRGFGHSGGRRAHVDSFAQYLDDVEDQMACVRALGVPVALLGHSMGGLIALSYVLDRRPAPDRLVLSGPALDANVPKALRALTAPLARVAPRARVPSPIDGSMLATDPAVGEAYFADPFVVRHTTPALGAALLRQFDWVAQRRSQLSLPTLVVHGGDDQLVPARCSAPLAELANVTRREYPGLRHEIFNEPSHEAVLSDVVDWIDRGFA